MFIVSSRVSWVIMVAPGSEKVVGTSTLTLVDRQDRCASGGVGAGRDVTEVGIGRMLEKLRQGIVSGLGVYTAVRRYGPR